jgi:hypothetical protein
MAVTRNSLYTLGFKEATNTSNLLEAEVGGYRIFIKIDPQDIAKSTIDYGPKITVKHAGVSNLSREENIVQLECVLRLLRSLRKNRLRGRGFSSRKPITRSSG